MEGLRVDFEPFVEDGVRKFINDGIDNYNIAVTGLPAYFPANFVLRSSRGEVLGGLLGMIWAGWLQVGTLWIAEAVRHQGHGWALLAAAEAYARDRGCIGVCLDTFSFQARPFYERHGYSVIGTQADYPPGHRRFFMEKRLA
ncbi:MAG TPA: GNAT family N-acetyltransferase [Caulobacteraceae bacterium]|nr:GNAT family N-acetyltransferase [Caulobacteraceae bacterium]